KRREGCDCRPYEKSMGGGVVQETRLAIRRSDPKGRRNLFRGSGKPAPTRLPTHRTTHPWRKKSLPSLQDGTRQEPNVRRRLHRQLWDSPSGRDRDTIEQRISFEEARSNS